MERPSRPIHGLIRDLEDLPREDRERGQGRQTGANHLELLGRGSGADRGERGEMQRVFVPTPNRAQTALVGQTVLGLRQEHESQRQRRQTDDRRRVQLLGEAVQGPVGLVAAGIVETAVAHVGQRHQGEEHHGQGLQRVRSGVRIEVETREGGQRKVFVRFGLFGRERGAAGRHPEEFGQNRQRTGDRKRGGNRRYAFVLLINQPLM